MKIMILGLGVIGTTYGYVFQRAGFETEHFIRAEKRESCPDQISVKLLDGRRGGKGKKITDTYTVKLAEPGSSYDFILVSVSNNKLKGAVETLNNNRIDGTILLMNGISDERSCLDAILGGRRYLLGYPVAGGQIDVGKAEMDCVLFDHVMLEREDKADIVNYGLINSAFCKAGIKEECPFDMLEWIWLHMAINAGVITTAATLGSIEDSAAAARRVMDSASALRRAILSIRECVSVVGARGVNLDHYKDEIMPYKLPSGPAGVIMKHMFKTNQLTRRIMELHANMDDLLYVCRSVHDKAKELKVRTPRFDKNYEIMMREAERL